MEIRRHCIWVFCRVQALTIPTVLGMMEHNDGKPHDGA